MELCLQNTVSLHGPMVSYTQAFHRTKYHVIANGVCGAVAVFWKFEFLTALLVRCQVFWDVTLCCSARSLRRFGGTKFYLQGRRCANSLTTGDDDSALYETSETSHPPADRNILNPRLCVPYPYRCSHFLFAIPGQSALSQYHIGI